MFNVTGLARGLSIGKIIGGISKTLRIANQIIPLYQRAKPAIANARNMISVLKEMNKKDVSTVNTNSTSKKTSNKVNTLKEQNKKAVANPTFFL